MQASDFVCLVAIVGAVHTRQAKFRGVADKWCEDGRVLPSVFLLGAQKSATTSLWKDMRDTLPLVMPIEAKGEDRFMRKEPQFFSKTLNFKQGRSSYTSRFPKCDAVGKKERGLDGTPNYLLGGEETAGRMKDFYGDKAKDLNFVVIVRDRSKRMQATFHQFMPNYFGGFDKYVEDTKGQAWDWAEGKAKSPGFIWEGSRYGEQLNGYLQHFSPEQFSIVTVEEYRNSPKETIDFIARRAGLVKKGEITPETEKHVNHKSQSEMSEHTRGTLNAFFAKYDKDFEGTVMKLKMNQGSSFKIKEDFDSGAGVKEDLYGTYE